MNNKIGKKTRLILATWMVLAGVGWLDHAAVLGGEPDLKAEFLRLCDDNCKFVEKQTQTAERQGNAVHYWDPYAVRALCVAYDMTGKQEYLEVCKRWADRMIEHQDGMIPKGAYYMLYGRKPGESTGDWYVADSSSIALGILATSIRCKDPAKKEKYLNSVKAFAKLVIDNFVRPSGGVTPGYWPRSDKEWWCSTGVFGSLAFAIYAETGDESYLKVGRDAIDWLNPQDFRTIAKHIKSTAIVPTTMMYCLEVYSTGLPYLKQDGERYQATMARWKESLDWMAKHQGGKAGINYLSQWGSKFGGLPFHMYVYANHVPGNEALTKAADKELRYIAGILEKAPVSEKRPKGQLRVFAAMSYAERLSPGSIYRTSRK